MDGTRVPQMRPDLLHGEAEDRCQQPNQRLTQAMQRRLRTTPGLRFRGRRIQAIFQNVEVDRAQVNGGKVINGTVDLVEGVLVRPEAAARNQVFGAHQNPLVNLLQFLTGNRIRRRVEVVDIAQHIAERVADLAVRFRETGQNHRRNAHVFREIDRGRPEPD